jgi:hypothetical protein
MHVRFMYIPERPRRPAFLGIAQSEASNMQICLRKQVMTYITFISFEQVPHPDQVPTMQQSEGVDVQQCWLLH